MFHDKLILHKVYVYIFIYKEKKYNNKDKCVRKKKHGLELFYIIVFEYLTLRMTPVRVETFLIINLCI